MLKEACDDLWQTSCTELQPTFGTQLLVPARDPWHREQEDRAPAERNGKDSCRELWVVFTGFCGEPR